MTAKTITKRLLSVLGLRVHKSVVSKARHTILSTLELFSLYLLHNYTYYFSIKEYNYRRSKCKPKEEYTPFEKRRRLIFALNNIDNNFETTVFVDESSIWALRGGLYHHRKKSSYPKCNTIHPRNVKKVHIWGGICWNGPLPYQV
jgi:hypothetical protein